MADLFGRLRSAETICVEPTPEHPAFRVIAHGYDRAAVDAYVRELAHDRDILRNRVEDLENALEATIDYLKARRAWQTVKPADVARTPAAETPTASLSVETGPRRLAWISTAASALLLVLAVGIAAYWRAWTPATDTDPAVAALAPVPAAMPKPAAADIVLAPDAIRAVAAAAVVDPHAEFIVSLATETVCWIGVAIDGERRTERLLQRAEQFSAHARKEILLRVGNAGAVALRINGRPAKPLGPVGQPATARITAANLEQFIAPGSLP